MQFAKQNNSLVDVGVAAADAVSGMRFLRRLYIPLMAFFFVGACTNATTSDTSDSVYLLSFDPTRMQTGIVQLIKEARSTIDVSLYGFENKEVAKALVEAHQRRGVRIRMSTEYDSEELEGYQTVILQGIPVKLGNTSGIQHNKYFIVDKTFLVTGSTNLTGSHPPESSSVSGMWAHYNNMVILRSPGLTTEFQKDFEIQWAGSYAGAKDNGYNTLYGTADWTETQYTLGSVKVNAYFTPYQDKFMSYRANLMNDLLCSTFGVAQTASNSGSIDAACANTALNFDHCYDDFNTRGVHRYFNADQNKTQCRTNDSVSYNNYRSALNIVISMLRGAKKSITCLFFAFTDRVLMQELINAKNRGVNVRIYIDYNQYRSQYGNSGASFRNLREKVGYVKIVRRHNGGLNHHKVFYVDDDALVLGSMNYSAAAVTSNDENFLLFRNAGSMIREFNVETARIDEQSFYMPTVIDDGDYIPTGEEVVR